MQKEEAQKGGEKEVQGKRNRQSSWGTKVSLYDADS